MRTRPPRPRRPRTRSLARGLLLLVPITAVLLALVVYMPLRTASGALDAEAERRVSTNARLAADVVERRMLAIADLVRSYANRPSVRQSLEGGDPAGYDLAEIQAQLDSLQVSTPGLRAASLVDQDGRLLRIAPALPDVLGQSFAYRDWFEGAIVSSDPYVSETYLASLAGSPQAVAVAMAIRPGFLGRGPVGAVLAVVVDVPAVLQDYVEDFASIEGDELVVVDQSGLVVARPGARPGALQSELSDPGFTAALDGRSTVSEVDADGESTLRAYQPLPDIGWAVGVFLPTDEAFLATTQLRRDAGLLALALALIGGLALAVLAHTLRGRGRAERELRAEREALQQSNDRFTGLLAAATEHAIYGMDADGYLTVFNEGAERLSGKYAEEVLGQHVATLMGADAQHDEARIDTLTFEAFVGDAARGGQETGEWTFTRPDGEVRTVSITITGMTGDDGELVGYIAIGTDVTARRAAEEALEESERRYRSIVDLADEGIWTTDAVGRTTFANRRMASMLGYEPAEMQGLPAAALSPEAGLVSSSRGVEDIPFRRRDGSTLWVMLKATPMTDEAGRPAGTVAMVTDVTLQRQARAELEQSIERERGVVSQLRELDRTKTDFVSSISHELRTPLTSIVGYVEMLADGDAGELNLHQGRMLEVVDRNSRRLLALIEDLLTLSRIESGAFKVTRSPVELGPLVRSVREAVLPAAMAAEHQLDFDVADDLGIVMGDAGQLERVLLNLLSNALKFTPPGGRVQVEVAQRGDRIVLSVQDSGIGIPLDEQSKLFTRFYRSSLAQERAIQGTGLGLTIIKTILENHQGTIDVVSAPGEGTLFTVSLPSVREPVGAGAGAEAR